MLRNLYAVLVLLCLTPATSSAQPATDIYLGILNTETTPIRVGSFRNITARAGYEQPAVLHARWSELVIHVNP